MNDMGVISCYFAHRRLHDEFLAGVHECRVILNYMKSLGCEQFMLGCDANTQLPSEIMNCTGPNCLKEPEPEYFERATMIVNVVEDFGLFAANIFDSFMEAQFTRQAWGKPHDRTPRVYQIDYLCLSHVFRASVVEVFNKKQIWRSDHFPIRAVIKTTRRMNCWTSRKSYSGWKLNGTHTRAEFGQRFIENMGIDIEQETFTIADFQDNVAKTALFFPHHEEFGDRTVQSSARRRPEGKA